MNPSKSGFDWEEGNYFSLLGVSRQASDTEIRKAYRRCARETHPDRFPLHSPERREAEAQFVLLTQARDTLLDPELRARYEAEQDQIQSLHLEALQQQFQVPFNPPPSRQNRFQDMLKKAYQQTPESGTHLDISETEGISEPLPDAKGTSSAAKASAAMFYYTQGLRYAARGDYRRAFYALSNAKMLDPEIDIPAHIMNKVRLYAYYHRR